MAHKIFDMKKVKTESETTDVGIFGSICASNHTGDLDKETPTQVNTDFEHETINKLEKPPTVSPDAKPSNTSNTSNVASEEVSENESEGSTVPDPQTIKVKRGHL